MDMRVLPGTLRGRIQAVPSKSALHRAQICQALGGGAMPLPDGLAAEDALATARCLKALCGTSPTPVLDCGESAATLRFLLPVAAAMGRAAVFTGGDRLAERPLTPLLSLLRAHGCRIRAQRLPLTISGKLAPGEYALCADITSQYVSGLLLALPLLRGDSEVRLLSPLVSQGYVEMTIRAMAAHGVLVEPLRSGFSVSGGQAYQTVERLRVEGDWSSAAFFFAANHLGGAVEVCGLADDSPQPDRAVACLLAEMRRGSAYIDVSQCPDLFPALAVAACGSPGGTVLKNAARLRHKESDRIRATSEMLCALGGRAVERPDGLVVCECTLQGGTVHSAGDHRIAMATAIAATVCRAPVIVRGAESVRKSYPAFWRDFRQLGGVADVV